MIIRCLAACVGIGLASSCTLLGLAPTASPDAAVLAPDAAVMTGDAGVPDSGTPLSDAGDPTPDASVMVADAAMPIPDASVTVPDAAVSVVDAGVPDAAVNDAAMAAPDAAIPPPDAGSTTVDAGGTSDSGPITGTPLVVGVGNWGLRARTGDGLAWSFCGNMSTGNDHSPDLLRNIGYGNGVFIAVGGDSNGMVMRSLDGVHWQEDIHPVTACPGEPYPSPCTNWQGGVAYGDGVWISGGGNGSLMRSLDEGLTWTGLHPTASLSAIRSVAFGMGRFVMGMDQGRVTTSADHGDTWTTQTLWTESFGAAYGGGQFIVSGRRWNGSGFDTACFLSDDGGDTWDPCAAAVAAGYAFTHDGTRWVARLSGGYATSTDGVTWQTVTTSNFPQEFVFDGTRWIGSGGGRGWQATTLDAWQTTAANTVADFRAMAVGRVLPENLPVTGVPECLDNR